MAVDSQSTIGERNHDFGTRDFRNYDFFIRVVDRHIGAATVLQHHIEHADRVAKPTDNTLLAIVLLGWLRRF